MEETRFRRNVDILDWYDALVFALAVLVLVFAFCARIVVVSGSSMNNTLTDGDRLLVQSTFYTPQRGDVVVVDSYINYGKPLVKRQFPSIVGNCQHVIRVRINRAGTNCIRTFAKLLHHVFLFPCRLRDLIMILYVRPIQIKHICRLDIRCLFP